MWAARYSGPFVHLYKNSHERVPVRYKKKEGRSGCRSFILFVFPPNIVVAFSYSLRLWAHSMCKTVQSNDLLLFLGGKKRLQLQSGTYKNWQKDLLMEGRRKTRQWKGSKKFKVKTKNWNGLPTHHRLHQLSSPAVGEAEPSGWWVSRTEGNVISTLQVDPLRLLKRQILWKNVNVSILLRTKVRNDTIVPGAWTTLIRQ